MANYTVADVKSDLQGMMHGTTIDKVTNFYNLLYRAGRDLLLDCDPIETTRIEQLSGSIYDEVTKYTLPSDLKGDKIIDIRPQVNRGDDDNFDARYLERFSHKKLDNTYAIEWDSGTKYLRLKKDAGETTTIESVEGITDNGTWAVSDDGTNLTKDTETYLSGGASLNFDVDGSSTTASISNSTFTAVDLSDHEDISRIFVNLYLPDSSAITSVAIYWGSSSSAYWSATATTAHFGAFQTGWNLVSVAWNGASETGSPDSSAIDYFKVTITYDGTADTDFRLDKITSRTGEIWDIVYYSKYIFQNSSGTWIEEPTATTDIVNLDTESYNLFLYKAAEMASHQTKTKTEDMGYFKNEYQMKLKRYKSQNKTQAIKPKSVYYTPYQKVRNYRREV